MARMAVILGSLVENIVEATPSFTIPNRLVVPANDVAYIGGQYINGAFVAPPAPPELTIEEIREAMSPLTPRQLRLGLLSIGIHEADVDMKLVSDPSGMVEWKYASYLKRTHPLVDGLGSLFSITPEQIDTLWLWAAEL